jgi:hypothetical protein
MLRCQRGAEGDMATGERLLRVRISGAADAVRRFLAQHPAEFGRVSVHGDQVEIDLTVDEPVAASLRDGGLRVVELYNADQRGRKAMQTVGRGNRFEGGRIPQGLGLRRRT